MWHITATDLTKDLTVRDVKVTANLHLLELKAESFREITWASENGDAMLSSREARSCSQYSITKNILKQQGILTLKLDYQNVYSNQINRRQKKIHLSNCISHVLTIFLIGNPNFSVCLTDMLEIFKECKNQIQLKILSLIFSFFPIYQGLFISNIYLIYPTFAWLQKLYFLKLFS